jgi:hypothetical protein
MSGGKEGIAHVAGGGREKGTKSRETEGEELIDEYCRI